MSLLLDALKRAEQEKQSRGPKPAGAASSPASARLELQPTSQPSAAASARPETAASPSRPAYPAAPARRAVMWAAVGVLVVAVIAGAGYVWYSVNALVAKPQPGALRAPPPQPIKPAASAPPAQSPSAGVFAGAGNAPSAAEANRANTASALEPTAPAAPEKPAARASRIQPSLAPSTELRRAKPQEVPVVPVDVAAGYAALRGGDLGVARRHYVAAIAADGANVDALVGLATVEARSGNRAAAVGLYRSALEVDPRNATALAGLAALAETPGSEALEARLAGEIARDPRSAALHFTLGNAHASAGRWLQAQAAYFEAHRLDPANADILHNLAVSLDHAGQPRLAAGFYRQALAAAREGAQFDRAAVARRLTEIDPGR